MNFFLCLILCLICFGTGWFISIKTTGDIKDLAVAAKESYAYIKKVEEEEIPNIDAMNMLINDNRNAGAILQIGILHDLELGNIENAKEKIINDLTNAYDSIREDEVHDMTSQDARYITENIEKLSKEHASFQEIMDNSLWKNE